MCVTPRNCRHCKERAANKGRRLCAVCSADRGIRQIYARANWQAPPPGKACKHCHFRVQTKPRGLCSRCYEDRAVRRLYPYPRRPVKNPGKPCRHCNYWIRVKPRGLCNHCFNDPAIRELYPVATTAFSRRGVLDYCGRVPLPATPTPYRPGSAEKVGVLEERAALQVALHHPWDAALEEE